MKINRLSISSSPSSQSSNEAYLTYTLPTKDSIQDFYSDKDFTLIVSNNGKIWKIGNFMQDTHDPFEYKELNLHIPVKLVTCNGSCALLLSTHGNIYGWGQSSTGILETGLNSSPTLIPALSPKKITHISISKSYAGCIDEEGSSFIWGTFKWISLSNSNIRLSDKDLFICKELECRDNYLALCTDGGFVYYLGNLAENSKKTYKKLSTFPELEEKFVLKVCANEKFVALLTDKFEVFVFDACCSLVKVPVKGVDQIVANKECLLMHGDGCFFKYFESGKTTGKDRCSLSEWSTKAFKISERFEINKIKAMNHVYGFIYTADRCDKIEGICMSLIGNESAGLRIKENDDEKAGKVLNAIEKTVKKLMFFGFSKIRTLTETKSSFKHIFNHSKLAYALDSIFYTYLNRNLTSGFAAIKCEAIGKSLDQRDKMRFIKEAISAKKKVRILKIEKMFSEFSNRNTRKTVRKSFDLLKIHKKTHETRQKKVFFLACLLKRKALVKALAFWQVKTSSFCLAFEKTVKLGKELKHKRLVEGFSSIFSWSNFLSFESKTRVLRLQRIIKNISHKTQRISFGIWKSKMIKLKAHRIIDSQKDLISVKIGCKFLFPVISFRISCVWTCFAKTCLAQVRPRYKNFAQFLMHFLQKVLNPVWAISFVRISGSRNRNFQNHEESRFLTIPNHEESNFASSSLVNSLNTLIKSPKKTEKKISSFQMPKLELTKIKRISKQKKAASFSFTRPSTKSRVDGSIGNLSQVDRKKNFGLKQNRCLKSLNIKPSVLKEKVEKQKKSKLSNKGQLELGLYWLERVFGGLRFRVKMKCFLCLKYRFRIKLN